MNDVLLLDIVYVYSIIIDVITIYPEMYVEWSDEIVSYDSESTITLQRSIEKVHQWRWRPWIYHVNKWESDWILSSFKTAYRLSI